MAIIYALANQKGGVGKTTTAINLGAYLAKLGQRVLLVDIDPQANATSSVGIDKRAVRSGSYEALLEVDNGNPTIFTNPKLKISILPSSPALAGAEVELVDELARETRLKRALAFVKKRYDYIIIDCPPSLGLLTLNGLVAAANGVLIPVQCEYLALEGLGQLTQTVERVRNVISPDLQIRGVILTMYDSRTNLANDVVQEVKRFFPNQVFTTIIPRNVRLAEAPSYGIPISEYDPGSAGAEAYLALAKEILNQDRKLLN
jgi:chromosome partitioning protein